MTLQLKGAAGFIQVGFFIDFRTGGCYRKGVVSDNIRLLGVVVPFPDLSPSAMRARVLYQDDDVLIFNKPTGVAVHAAGRLERHLEMYLDPLRFDSPENPRLAHRLDMGTSGCLLLGRHDVALRRLGLLFQNGFVDKTYWAVVEGGPVDESGVIDLPLIKGTGTGGARMVTAPDGLPAVTDYRVLGRLTAGRTWLELRPRTGRMHQLRAHCAYAGFPIVGDDRYNPDEPTGRQPLHLHARSLWFRWQNAGPNLGADAPVPPHMETCLSGEC